jgi:hypothetical protein
MWSTVHDMQLRLHVLALYLFLRQDCTVRSWNLRNEECLAMAKTHKDHAQGKKMFSYCNSFL